MKKNTHVHIDLLCCQPLPTLSLDILPSRRLLKKRIAAYLPSLKKLLISCFITLALCCVLTFGTWLFLIQLAEHGW